MKNASWVRGLAAWVLVVGCGHSPDRDAITDSASNDRARDEVPAADASARARDGDSGSLGSRARDSGSVGSRARDSGSVGSRAGDSGSAASSSPDASCGSSYVVHGAACSTPGATATGPAPECGDVHYECPRPAACSCVADEWSCPRCPRCIIDLARPNENLGGGIQFCEGGTLTQCDGTTREVSGSCTYRGFSLWCAEEGDISIGCSDAGRLLTRDAGPDGAAR